MIDFFKKHYLVFVLAFLLSLFTFGPQLWAINSIGDNFSGIYPVKSGDELYYAARAHEVVDGHIYISNPYLYEYKSGEPVQFWVSDYILTKPLSLFGLDVYQIYFLHDFVLTFILALLVYFVFFKLTGNKVLSLASVFFINLALFFNLFSRAPSPQFNFIFFLLLTWLLIALNRHQKKKYFIWASIIFGFLFHIYTYYWTFYVVWLVIFLLLNKIHNKKFNLSPYVYMTLGAFVIAIPYFVSLFKNMQLSYYDESIYRLGMIDTHFPSGLKIVVLAGIVLLFFFWAYKKKWLTINSSNIFLFSGVLAAIVSVNQHIITGKNLEFSSHYLLPSIFVICLAFAYILNKSPFVRKKYFYVLIFALIVFVGYQPVVQEIKSSATFKPEQVEWQKYGQAFRWLDQNTPKDSVVFANENVTVLLPTYTHNNVFYNRHANIHFMPDEEVYDRFLIHNYWNKIDEDFLYDEQTSIWGVHYIDTFGHLNSRNSILSKLGFDIDTPPIIPEDKIEEMLKLSKELKSKSFEENISKYKVDYLLLDKSVDQNWDFSGELLYQDNDIYIYKL